MIGDLEPDGTRSDDRCLMFTEISLKQGRTSAEITDLGTESKFLGRKDGIDITLTSGQ